MTDGSQIYVADVQDWENLGIADPSPIYVIVFHD
jgi:hypothetical protein